MPRRPRSVDEKRGERIKVFYSPATDSLSIRLRAGDQEIAGEIMGEDLNENAVLHHDDARTLYDIEGVGGRSEVLDL
jgi:hypothetical protein